MGKITRIGNLLSGTIIIILMLSVEAGAQSLGNPFSPPKNAYSIGIGIDLNEHIIDDYEYTSTRPLSKVTMALSSFFDVSLFLGASNMHIVYPRERQLSRLWSRFDVAVGAGAKMRIPTLVLKNNWLFLDGGYYRSKAEGTTKSESVLDQSTYSLKYEMEEFWGTAGTLYRTHRLDLYAGYQGRVIHQHEVLTAMKYKSGIISSIIAGCDIKLSNRWIVNMQARALNGATLSLGISQYGFYR